MQAVRVFMIHDVKSYNHLLPLKYRSYPNVNLIINSNYIIITTVTIAAIATSEKKSTHPAYSQTQQNLVVTRAGYVYREYYNRAVG